MPFAEYAKYAQDTYTLPDLCIKLRQLLDDPSTDSRDISRLIGIDAALTSKVLRLANSALFRFEKQVGDIDKANTVIGGEAIYNLVLAETANKAVFAFHNDLVDPVQHWNKSILMGVQTKALAKTKVRGSERYFLLGILYWLGEMVIAQHSPEAYQAYLNDDKQCEPWQKQMQYFGADIAMISGGIMEEWGLPLSIYAPLLDAHNMQIENKPMDELLLMQAQAILWCCEEASTAEQRFFNAGSLRQSELDYNEINELYSQAQLDAKKIQQLI